MTKEEIGAILKRLRIDAGKTQKEVAELLGRSQQVVGHWETGYAQPDANTLFLLCDIYNADMNYAFGFTNSSKSSAEQEHIKKYRRLNDGGKEKIDEQLDDMLKLDKYTQPDTVTLPVAARGGGVSSVTITKEEHEALTELLKQPQEDMGDLF